MGALGVFHIDEIGKTRNVIRIKAIDAMINLDMPYSLSAGLPGDVTADIYEYL